MSEDRLGATPLPDGRCRFVVWAPRAERVEVVLADRAVPMDVDHRGYHRVTVPDCPPGARYQYRLDGGPLRPDPASRLQPVGVHGPSEVVDPSYPWTDGDWRGVRLRDLVIYELHVGTFSEAGTFDGVIADLDRLVALGVTAIELMPVAAFPGERNWGYDGVSPFAAHAAYGGPDGLARLVDAAHARGLAVLLDVVYNHLGPEGNYLSEFGPYFTEAYHTPWGPGLSFDEDHADDVRRFFLESALHWLEDLHLDGLRLDAVHAIRDQSPVPFLEELSDRVREASARSGRRIHLVAESDQNDPRMVRPSARGGYGLDAVWADDLHHALHARITGERDGYYEDYGGMDAIVRAFRDGFAWTGQYSAHRRRRHGRPAPDVAPERFVVCSQNHDQIGNRMRGERLTALVGLEGQKLAAGLVLLSPHTPLLFMGEEYGETAPFQYFVSHGDEGLVEAVREGRKQEFAAFEWEDEPPDPQAEATFERSRLNRALREEEAHAAVERLYRALLGLRSRAPELRAPDDVFAVGDVLYVRAGRLRIAFNLSREAVRLTVALEGRMLLDAADGGFAGGEGTVIGAEPELPGWGFVVVEAEG